MKKFAFVSVFCLFIALLMHIGKESDRETYQKLISEEYIGIIKSIYFRKTTHMEIEINRKIQVYSIMSSDVEDEAEVGDTIYKPGNKNECFVNGVHLEYISLPDFAKDLDK
ncbi:hypothetical protein [Hymenobacter lapidiphilus]|uniref:Uncharacterized protein n=1 Tax=Hymenobacter lapidiphilus TaxID=2608003 RepID=A0A7Y7PMD7_9BACT|nr:hypothetical protein [Hymenobacter lapidiphilus]NVO30483.1 hypothetical protein [Hymenobacter lapidiphilus]